MLEKESQQDNNLVKVGRFQITMRPFLHYALRTTHYALRITHSKRLSNHISMIREPFYFCNRYLVTSHQSISHDTITSFRPVALVA